jgi:OmpA-OmpF porin, OOP family
MILKGVFSFRIIILKNPFMKRSINLFFLVFLIVCSAPSSSQSLVNNLNAGESEAALVGFVTDINKVPEIGVPFTVKSEDKKISHKGITDEDGKFAFVVPKGKKYNVTVQKMGMEYDFVTQIPNVPGPLEVVQNYVMTLVLNFARIYQLERVYFDTNKSDIREESMPSLDSLVNIFIANPMFMAEIAGHTDNMGNDEENTRLSQRRADSIKQYLVGKGVEPFRILTKGYGKRHPLVSNDTPEGRKINRRTEVKVLFE